MNNQSPRYPAKAGRFGICLYLVSCILAINLTAFALQKNPQRIVSGMPSVTEMLFALGLGDRIVGVTTNCNYPPQAARKQRVGGFFLNLEKIVSLKPDLIVMLEDAQKRDIKKFKDFGLPVYIVNPHTIREVMDTMLELGEMTGTRPRAEKIVGEMRQGLRSVAERVSVFESEGQLVDSTTKLNESGEEESIEVIHYHVLNISQPRVLVIVGFSPLIVVGGGTLIHDMIDYAGAQNIAEKTRAAYPQYSFERLLSEDPDYIIIPEGTVRKEEFERDKRWQSLKAVREKKVLFINADILSRPGPRAVEAVREIADFLYQ